MKVVNFELTIDPSSVKEKIVSKITDTMQKKETEGCLVIFSGQNDSFAAANLTIEAAGIEAVKLVIISDVPKERREQIASIAKTELKIPQNQIFSFNIKGIYKKFESIEELVPITGIPVSRQQNISHLLLRTKLVQKIVEEKTFSHIGKTYGSRDKFFRELIAYSKAKKRLKTILAYLIAEKENLLLVSKTNKTEYKTGLYTIFGYGHAADIMPLGDLYRTQVLQLSEYFGVPQEIRDHAHSDIMPGVVNKYQYFFELDSNIVDKILIRLEAKIEVNSITEELNIEIQKVNRVKHFFDVSKLQEVLPIIPYINK